MTKQCLCLLGLVLATGSAFAEETKSSFDELQLRDSYGNVQTLGKLAEKEFTVVAFLGTECPLAKLYGPRLRQLSDRFKDVAFIGVNSNIQDTLREVSAYTDRCRIKFPMLVDTEHKLANLLQAERTPEVFVLDRDRNVHYRGRIDDQYAISVAKLKPAVEDLAEALSALEAGKEPKQARTKAVGCIIGRRKQATPTGDVTYSKHIAPIFNKRCAECHRDGELAPFALSNYEDTIGWTDMIAEVIGEGRMPPWNANPKYGHFKNDARLSAEEKQLVLKWINNGAPEGDKTDLPEPPKFVEGWRIEKPDDVYYMPKKYSVPATGVVDYKHFRIDPGFKKDMYVSQVEARPGNPEVVHHIVVYVLTPEMRKQRSRRRGLGMMLIGYAPGTSPLVYPEGAGMKIPAGSQFIFEMHYTPNGEKATDLSYCGVKFIDRKDVKQEIIGTEVMTSRFRIRKNDPSFEVTAHKPIEEDIKLVTLTPHMHLRGKSFRYIARIPGQEPKVLLDVPKYDFNWQLRYELKEPVLLPKGSTLTCIAKYDNSEGNPNNPNPNKEVRWGDQSWEEMMIGFYAGVRPAKSSE